VCCNIGEQQLDGHSIIAYSWRGVNASEERPKAHGFGIKISGYGIYFCEADKV